MSYRILTLNPISPRGLARFPAERYEVGADIEQELLLLAVDLHRHRHQIAGRNVLQFGRCGDCGQGAARLCRGGLGRRDDI